MKPIPISKPKITWREYVAVLNALRSGWLTHLGPASEKMRAQLREFAQKTWENEELDVALTSNGTVALHLALLAAGVERDDEVIVPNLSYVAVVNSVLYCGAKPVIADINPVDWNLDIRKIQNLVSTKTKAIILVDNYGRNFTFKEARPEYLKKIKVIRDISESFPDNEGDYYTDFDFATVSFFANKIITTGEGGAVFANKELIKKIRILKNQGIEEKGTFNHQVLGYNYRITNLAAAIFTSQWKQRGSIIKKRKKIFDCYKKELLNLNIDHSTNNDIMTSPWLFTIRLHNTNQKKLKDIQKLLKTNKIETRTSFKPLNQITYIQGEINNEAEMVVSKEYAESIISLPTFIGLKKRQIRKICELIKTEMVKI